MKGPTVCPTACNRMAQVTLAGVDGEAPPPLCSCCPVGVEQASLNRLGRVESFLSQSQIPFCREVTPPKKPPLLYANPTAGVIGHAKI